MYYKISWYQKCIYNRKCIFDIHKSTSRYQLGITEIIHVASAKAKRDRRMDRQMNDEQSVPYVVLCFAGATNKERNFY